MQVLESQCGRVVETEFAYTPHSTHKINTGHYEPCQVYVPYLTLYYFIRKACEMRK